jgi:hypothetical protein
MRKLNWIKNQQTADKYLTSIANYAGRVQHNDADGARTVLHGILQSIVFDSLNVLTAKACGLVRSDVESLLQH